MRAKRWCRLIGCGFGLVAILASVVVSKADTLEDVVFDDGEFHLFRDDCDNLLVRDGPSGIPTHVEMAGQRVRVSRDAWVFGNSKLSMHGVIEDDLYLFDRGEVTVAYGAVLDSLQVYDSSRVMVTGGGVGGDLLTHGSSQAAVSGGAVDRLFAYGNSDVKVSGGRIERHLSVDDGSSGIISGGTIEGSMAISSELTLRGSDFSIDGQATPFGEYGQSINPIGYSTVSGTLASGEVLSTEFKLHDDGQLILTPEPATLALLAVGGLGVWMRRRRRA